jgi:hypothetical protein
VDPRWIFGKGAPAGKFRWIELRPHPVDVLKHAQPTLGYYART